MLFIREDLEKMQQTSQEEQQRVIQVMVKWVEELSQSGNFISGEPLEPEMRLAKVEEIVHGGAFAEIKEGISGYLIINAENIEQASELAQGCPELGQSVKSIEVRPILKY